MIKAEIKKAIFWSVRTVKVTAAVANIYRACTLEANSSTFFSTSALSSRWEALGFFFTKSATLWMHSL